MFSVLQFPGSNDDRDLRFALKAVLGAEARLVWHKDAALPAGHRRGARSRRLLLRRLPALRGDGALLADHGRRAAASPTRAGRCSGSATASRSCARRGSCPGALRAQPPPALRVRASCTCASSTRARRSRRAPPPGQRAAAADQARGGRLPPRPTARRARARTARWCCATDAGGARQRHANPNGSLANIAGVATTRGNVVGLMPHPEHAVEPGVGGEDGAVLLGSLVGFCTRRAGTGEPPRRAARRPRARARARPLRRRVRAGRADPRPHAELFRARDLLGDVVGALLVQVEQEVI